MYTIQRKINIIMSHHYDVNLTSLFFVFVSLFKLFDKILRKFETYLLVRQRLAVCLGSDRPTPRPFRGLLPAILTFNRHHTCYYMCMFLNIIIVNASLRQYTSPEY